MKVHTYSREIHGECTRITATVTWEDCDRDEKVIYFETDSQFADDLRPDPNAFLLAAIMPAMRHGERRIRVDGTVCPNLYRGLEVARRVLSNWYGEKGHRPITIEATQGVQPLLPCEPRRAASFMSGGLDALATLRSNRLDYPLDHPDSIRDCFFVHGFDIGGYEKLESNRENSQTAIDSLRTLSDQIDVNLIPVQTNQRYLDDDDLFFARDSHGAALASVAHAFSTRISSASIATGSSLEDLEPPHGSHPYLDPNFSTSHLEIVHDGVWFSRLEKARMVGNWEQGLATLRACFDAFRPVDALNCGECEKCLRTMTELLVLGKLAYAPTYPYDDLTPEMIGTLQARPENMQMTEGRVNTLQRAYRMLNPGNVEFWRELVEPLRNMGRDDLVITLTEKLTVYDTWRAEHAVKLARLELRTLAANFDRDRCGGTLKRLRRLFT